VRGSGPPVAHGPAAGPRATVAEGSGNPFAKDVHAAVLVTAALCAFGAAWWRRASGR
jgi:hypothetical protein